MDKDYDQGGARNTDPSTSFEAAALVDTSALIQQIYKAMAGFGDDGCIGDEVEDLLPEHTNQTISPRYIQMVERGMIEVTEEKRKGHHHGRLQMVRRVLQPPFTRPRKIPRTHCRYCGAKLGLHPREIQLELNLR